MAKRGGTRHLKRIAAPKTIPIHDKKESIWLLRTRPGPHALHEAVPLGVLLRDVLQITSTMRETKKILAGRFIYVDGKPRSDPGFPVGFMDILDIPKAGKTYCLLVDSHGRLQPREWASASKNEKLAKVVHKYLIKNGKVAVTLHDGKTLQVDTALRVGDSVRVQIPVPKIQRVIPLQIGARCMVREGKHAGTIATLEEIIQRKEGRASEARLRSEKEGEFITVAKYLFVVDEAFPSVKGASS